MHPQIHAHLTLCVFFTFCLLPYQKWAQSNDESSADDIEALERIEQSQFAFQEPDGVGESLGDDALRFFLLAARSDNRTFYYTEDEAYKPLRAAYNTFGNMHRISPRENFVLYGRKNQNVGGEERIAYTPLYELNVAGRSDIFAIFLPIAQPEPGAVIRMNALDFSLSTFPYGQVTFMNILPRPLMVLLADQRSVVAPGEILRAKNTIRRKGAGFLDIALAIRAADGEAKLLYRQHLAVFEGERSIAMWCSSQTIREWCAISTEFTGFSPERTMDGFVAESVYIDRRVAGGPENWLREEIIAKVSHVFDSPAKGYFLVQESSLEIHPNEPNLRRYRMFIFDGEITGEEAETLWQNFASQ